MEQKLSNVKKWSQWLIAGIITLIAVAGLIFVIVTSGSRRDNNTDLTQSDNTSEHDNAAPNDVADPTEDNNNSAATQPESTPSAENPTDTDISTDKTTDKTTDNLPQTGPADSILPIVGITTAGIAAYLIALLVRRAN